MEGAMVTEESDFTCCFLGTHHATGQSQAEGGLNPQGVGSERTGTKLQRPSFPT